MDVNLVHKMVVEKEIEHFSQLEMERYVKDMIKKCDGHIQALQHKTFQTGDTQFLQTYWIQKLIVILAIYQERYDVSLSSLSEEELDFVKRIRETNEER